MERNFTRTETENITFTSNGEQKPYWTNGEVITTPSAGTVLHTHQCTSGKTTNIIGFYIDTTDVVGNRFIIRWKHGGVEHVHPITLSAMGTVNSEGFAVSGIRPADAQSQITIETANNASAGAKYYAKFLLQEVLIQ